MTITGHPLKLGQRTAIHVEGSNSQMLMFRGLNDTKKNWLILKIQPSGFVPLNRETSNFVRWEVEVDVRDVVAVEEDGEGL